MARWKVDQAHSEVQFKVKHLMINTVTGRFRDYDVTVETEGTDFNNAQVRFEARVNSVDTGIEMRDNHLRSNDFFHAEAFPTMNFISTGMNKTGKDSYLLSGDLTIRGITKPVVLHVTYGGTIVDPNGNIKAGFEATGAINRKDFGLLWNGLTEAGNIVVADEVRIVLNIQLLQLESVTSQGESEFAAST